MVTGCYTWTQRTGQDWRLYATLTEGKPTLTDYSAHQPCWSDAAEPLCTRVQPPTNDRRHSAHWPSCPRLHTHTYTPVNGHVPPIDFRLQLLQKRTSEDNWRRIFNGRKHFLSPNKLRANTETHTLQQCTSLQMGLLTVDKQEITQNNSWTLTKPCTVHRRWPLARNVTDTKSHLRLWVTLSSYTEATLRSTDSVKILKD